ncbi:MAG: hypothetical protein NTW21_12790 [Verrucomicrobia bacterium]|nr:hypothetical protein [Verrucomicrobiota bacterium]
MKSNFTLRFVCVGSIATLLASLSVQAALEWDGSDLITPGAQGGAGTWNGNNTANWWDSSTSADVVWPASGTDHDAIFGGAAGGNVILASVTANDLTFNTSFLFWSSGGSGNPTGSSSSTVKVDGPNSTFSVTGSWDLADRGTGNQFKVLNGGTANMTGGGYVGYYTGNVAVLIDGTNSVWNTAAVDRANGGSSASATVSNNGRWNANGQITFKNNHSLSLNSGGELNVQTLNLAAAGGRLNFNGGRLIAQSSGSLVNGAGQIDLIGAAYIKTDYTKSIGNLIYDVGSLSKEGTGELTLSTTT